MLSHELVARLKEICERRELTVTCAESCTGGLLSAALTEKSGASRFFLGSVVSYHRQVKTSVLKVPSALIDVHGEVSEPVALAMAQGARAALGGQWSMSITGVAGPTGGTVEKPVGYVCFAVVGPGGYAISSFRQFAEKDRAAIQQASVQHSLELLLNALR